MKVTRKPAKRKAAKRVTKKKAVRKPAKRKPAKRRVVRKVAKKPAKRKVARRPVKKAARKPAKKATAKLNVYKLAQEAPDKRFFVLANGKPVKHVAELAAVLEDLEEHVFNHHVNPEKNDFHTWVKDVFKDLALAKKMLGVSDKKQLQLVIYKHAAHKAFAHKG